MPPITIAHRAGNGLAALAQAFDAGADYAEADVWHRRGRVEVRHDKTAGPLPFVWDRWSLKPSLGRRLLLDDLLRATAGRGKLFLDMKGDAPGLATAVAMIASETQMRDRVAASGNWQHLDRLAQLLPGAPRFYSVGSLRQCDALRPRLARRDIPGVSIDSALLSPAIVEELRQAGVRLIVTWHVETKEQAGRVLGWGVDGITSRNLALLAAIRRGEVFASKD